MKKSIIIILAVLFILVPLISSARVSVKGYYRKNGTYVAPHYRSDPDGIKSNNYSYPGNYNPNTGQITPGGSVGYIAPSGPAATVVPQVQIINPINQLNLKQRTLVKSKLYSDVFYVNDNYCLQWVTSESAAKRNFGTDWNLKINNVTGEFKGYKYCEYIK